MNVENPSSKSMSVRDASIRDAEILASFGAKTFHDTHAMINAPEDMAFYLAENFTPERLCKELNEACFLLVEQEKKLIAYAKLQDEMPPVSVSLKRSLHLVRFYVDKPWHGQGVSQTLMEVCENSAIDKDYEILWLNVWEYNHRAIAFYSKCGFRDVGMLPFQMGANTYSNRILMKPVKANSETGH